MLEKKSQLQHSIFYGCIIECHPEIDFDRYFLCKNICRQFSNSNIPGDRTINEAPWKKKTMPKWAIRGGRGGPAKFDMYWAS